MKNIFFVASECMPFVKTGGLADVVGSLRKHLDKRYFDCRVILPLFSFMPQRFKDMLRYKTHFYMDYNWNNYYVGVLEMDYDGIHYYFIDNQDFFSCDKPYAGMPYDIYRYGFFCKAALSAMPNLDFRPDVIHCHDWQTALIPVYLNDSFQANPYFQGIKTVMTIHNLKFQAIWDIKTVKSIVGLPEYYFTPDKLEYKTDANLLKGGLVYADAITTVSKTYAEEIKMPYYGEGLDGLLRARAHDRRGIVNGIDDNEWNPATDNIIYHNYDPFNFRNEKWKNKTALQWDLGLNVDSNAMLIGIVSRLTDQKGFDLIAYVMDELCQDAVQFVILGTGEERYENMFRHYAWKYGGKVTAQIYYNEALAHKIYAGCDAFLMPSQFEPCGLSQLISLRFGTLPIVRETGGLKDTVWAFNEYENTGTGFSFANYNAHEMMATVRYAERIYYDRREQWNQIVERAMAQDFSWGSSAHEYQDLYDWLISQM